MRIHGIIAAITSALLLALLAGCGGYGPTLPSPNISGGAGPSPGPQPAPQPEPEPQPQPGDLTVRVQLETGEPVAGATVKLYQSDADPTTTDPLSTAQTANDGTVTFSDLPAGEYLVLIVYQDKTEQRRPTVPEGDRATVVVILPVEQQQPAGALRVCCKLAAGDQLNPLPGVEIEVYALGEVTAHPQQAAPVLRATTGDDGCALFEDLQPGSYLVRAFYENDQQEKEAQVQSGQTTEVDFTFTVPQPETASLTVRVLRPIELARPRSEPVEGATVRLYRRASGDVQPEQAEELVATGVTDANGEAHFTDLPLDYYRAVATDPVYNDTAENTIDLALGNNLLIIMLAARIGAIRACVVMDQGDGPQPVEGALVVLYVSTTTESVNTSVASTITAETGPDGCVVFDTLPPGTHSLFAQHPTLDATGSAENVSVVAGQITNVTILLQMQQAQ